MKKLILFPFLFMFLFINPASDVLAEDQPNLTHEVSQLKAEIENMTLDRKNLVKQAATFQREKEELEAKLEEIQDVTSGSGVELESLRKESEILKSEIEKAKAARLKDKEDYYKEKRALEQTIEDQKARGDHLLGRMDEFSPDKIDDLVADRNRLEQENGRLAQRIFEFEAQVEELKTRQSPLELDREELHRLRAENDDLQKRIAYVGKLEARQEEVIRENKQYREELEVLKSKFKEAAPGLAKASRISQKMMKENADMHYNLGTIFLHNKKYAEALKEYENVLELRPNDPETHYNLGILYDDYIKDREKALYHFQKYLSISPKAPDAKKVESYILSLELEQKVR